MRPHDYFSGLKSVLYMLEEVELNWLPGKSNKYRGIVSNDGKTIFIFDDDEDQANETILHEVLNLLIVKMANSNDNSEITRIGKEIYLAEMLRKLVSPEELVNKGSREEIIHELKRLGCKSLND